MTTSLDELHRVIKKPGRTRLFVFIGAMVVLVVLTFSFIVSPLIKAHLEQSEQYKYTDYSQCGPGGFAYLQAAADKGDLQAQRMLRELQERCRLSK